MATAAQVQALIKSHYSGNNDMFYTVSLQIACDAKNAGRDKVSDAIRSIIDAKKNASILPEKVRSLLMVENPVETLTDMVIRSDLRNQLIDVVKEYTYRDRLAAHGLAYRRKLLMIGPPGTGKTMTARVLAHELGLPLYIVQIDRIMGSYMGESAARLRLIFDNMPHFPGVYFFDEFDSVGANRSRDHDVGEVRRILNALIQFIDQDNSGSFFLAATNLPELLDKAFIRRFDNVLKYTLPNLEEDKQLINMIFARHGITTDVNLSGLTMSEPKLSHSEIYDSCIETIRQSIITNTPITLEALVTNLNSREDAIKQLGEV